MGILNVTPDSFADGGRLADTAAVSAAARAMIGAGADVLDLGAESTRPGAARVDAAEQCRRILPAIAALRAVSRTIPITIDTTREEVASAGLDAGADAINDVSAGAESGDGTLRLAAARACGIVLMHRLSPPGEDSYSDRYSEEPMYADVVEDVRAFLRERATRAEALGVRHEGIMVDPGLGFGKSVEQNVALIERTAEIASMGYPVLSGLSRKSFVGRVTLGRDSTPGERLEGTLAMSVRHMKAGAAIFRVHDVAEHRRVLDEAR
jgi:dihydropteroate synthase